MPACPERYGLDQAVADPETAMSIGVIVVAYNAAATLAAVLDRIPQSFRARVSEVVVCDDASSDSTYVVGVEYQKVSDLPLTVLRRSHNLGYGGNQKAAYAWAIERELDVVVLLHGDGQYAPEVIEDIVRPLECPDVDAVFGSRMMVPGSARLGGMPLYKLVGNRILSSAANSVSGLDLSEWHSGYRAYRVSALAAVPFMENSDGFDFDTQIILQLHEAGRRIVEVPIPTYYGDEICYVKGTAYAAAVVRDLCKYRMRRMGLAPGMPMARDTAYELKASRASSHGRLRSWLGGMGPKRILDLGCSDGSFGEVLRREGHRVVGVDMHEWPGVRDRLDDFIPADLNQGLPGELPGPFDVVLAADVIEHLAQPEVLLRHSQRVLAPGGVILVSVPNISHWYGRLRVASGRFHYDSRGLFDAGHLRFFTSAVFERLADQCGLAIRKRAVSGLPFEVVERGGPTPGWAVATARWVDGLGAALAPNLFGYQLLFELAPKRREQVTMSSAVRPLRARRAPLTLSSAGTCQPA